MTTCTCPEQPAPGADPDRRDPEPLGDRRRQLLGHQLEHDREGARLLDRKGVAEQGPRGVLRLALDAHLADRVDRLRRQPDVAHDRDAGARDRLDRARAAHAALELDGLGAALARAGAPAFSSAGFDGRVAHERHVADDERAAGAAGHGLHVVEHVRHRDRDLVLVPEDHAPDRVADEQQRDAGLVEQARRRVVVRGEHRDPLAVGVQLGDVDDGEPPDGVGLRGLRSSLGLR